MITTRLDWTTFDWIAVSNRADGSQLQFIGSVRFSQKPTVNLLSAKVLSSAAKIAHEMGVAWDPFNVSAVAVPHR